MEKPLVTWEQHHDCTASTPNVAAGRVLLVAAVLGIVASLVLTALPLFGV